MGGAPGRRHWRGAASVPGSYGPQLLAWWRGQNATARSSMGLGVLALLVSLALLLVFGAVVRGAVSEGAAHRRRRAGRRHLALPGPARPAAARCLPGEHRQRRNLVARLGTLSAAAAGTAAPGRGGRSQSFSRDATCSAIASDAVSPGDSMPNRFTSPGTPCSAGPWIRKSRAGSPGPAIFGRMPA